MGKKTINYDGLKGFTTYYRPYRGLLAADMAASAAVAALALLLPFFVRYITGELLERGEADVLRSILRAGMLMMLIISCQTVCAVFYDYKGHDMGARIERDMRAELFAHLQSLPFEFYDNSRTGELMSRLNNDLLNMAELCHHGPENIVIYGTQFAGALIVLPQINWRLTLVVCALLPLMTAYSFVFYRKLQRVYTANREHIASINALAEENLSGIRTVKSFANEDIETAKFGTANAGFYASRSSVYKHEALHFSVMERFFTPLITAAIVVTGGIWIAGGALDLPNLLLFIMYAAYLTGPVPKLAFMVQQYQEGISGYRRFREIMDVEPAIRDAENAAALHVTDGRVTFDDVTFRYKEGREHVLRGISLDVAGGETVAIVGRSGIGKTTLCSLIPRFYDVCGGAVRIDGADVRSVTLKSLREQIGVVRQETFLFSGTVMENILYGRPGASEEDVVEAAVKAGAHRFIAALPRGYHTQIGQQGVLLSAGQRQRISIARVFLKDPPILIFDEATSALDYESERAVMDSLSALSRGRTTFIIAHRLWAVRSADRIVVLSGEGVAEQGTHDELYARGGEYAAMCDAQVV